MNALVAEVGVFLVDANYGAGGPAGLERSLQRIRANPVLSRRPGLEKIQGFKRRSEEQREPGSAESEMSLSSNLQAHGDPQPTVRKRLGGPAEPRGGHGHSQEAQRRSPSRGLGRQSSGQGPFSDCFQ